MTSQADLERARSDASYRPKFISEINIDDYREYVNSVAYCSIDARAPNGDRGIMTTIPALNAVDGIQGSKSNIIITPYAFSPEIHETLDDFLSSLIDHEILGHAKLIFEGAVIGGPAQELVVLLAHKERLRRRNYSDNYLSRVMQNLAELEKLFERNKIIKV